MPPGAGRFGKLPRSSFRLDAEVVGSVALGQPDQDLDDVLSGAQLGGDGPPITFSANSEILRGQHRPSGFRSHEAGALGTGQPLLVLLERYALASTESGFPCPP